MSTLRAAAFILNSALILLAAFLIARTLPDNQGDLITDILVIAAPTISILTIYLQSRARPNNAG